MLRIRPIGSKVAAYYLRQGDGTWIGAGAADIGLEGPVTAADLGAVLTGRVAGPAHRPEVGPAHRPEVGPAHRPEVGPAHRRAGWDLVFAAPKSLSLLAMSRSEASRSEGSGPVLTAQRAAVSEAISHFESALLHVRRSAAPDGRAPATGAIAARFDHVANAGGEPHVHSHVLLANLARDQGGRWSAIGGWWLERRELDAMYMLGLRHHLSALGLDLDWRVRPDGLLDVAGVPRAALRATSTRTHESLSGARYSGRKSDPGRPWRDRAGVAGWDPARARLSPADQVPVVGVAAAGASSGAADLSGTVTTRLALKGSAFGRRDVLLTLAGLPEARFTAEAANRWVEGFLSGCTEVGRSGPAMWTSKLAESADLRFEAVLRERIAEQRGPVNLGSRPELARSDDGIRDCVGQILGGHPVVVLGCDAHRSGFLSHTAILSACAEIWESAGMAVAVSTRSPFDALRWVTLTGIGEFRASKRPDVVVVDQADRRTSSELAVLLDAAGGAQVVLVEGGTSLRRTRPASRVVEHLDTSVPRVLNRIGAPAWDVGSCGGGHPVERVLGRWAECLDRSGSPPILVGLGVPETEALNDAARRHLAALQHLNGPEIEAHGRRFRVGETVVAIRPLGNGLPAGTLGTVTALDVTKATACIRWPHRDFTADRAALARIGHGYATTPRLASRSTRSALVLGPSEGIGIERSRVVEAFSARGREGLTRARESGGLYGPETWSVQR